MKKRAGNSLNIIIFISVVLIGYNFCFNSSNSAPAQDIDLSAENLSIQKLVDPIQSKYNGDKNDFIEVKKSNLDLKIYPKANYKIYAMVMGKKAYRHDWNSQVAPYDLALAWNKLMLPENQQGIRFSQSNRWAYYRYDGGYPLSKSYINSHFSNHHMIPHNQNLRKALDNIRKKEKIYLEGYLVYINGTYKNRKVWWKSSLRRTDSGDGACEVFYITKAIIRNKVYE